MKSLRKNSSCFATPPAPYRSPGPSGPRVENVSKTVSQQSPESRNSLFRDSGDCFETVLDTFSTPGPEGPRRLSRRLFGVPGPKGPGDSGKGRGEVAKQELSDFCSLGPRSWRPEDSSWQLLSLFFSKTLRLDTKFTLTAST